MLSDLCEAILAQRTLEPWASFDRTGARLRTAWRTSPEWQRARLRLVTLAPRRTETLEAFAARAAAWVPTWRELERAALRRPGVGVVQIDAHAPDLDEARSRTEGA